MTPIEIANAAVQAMNQSGCCGVILTMRKGGMPKGFPRGELLNEMERNGDIERTYNFDPMKILWWLNKNGLISMRKNKDNSLIIEQLPEAEKNEPRPKTTSEPRRESCSRSALCASQFNRLHEPERQGIS